MRRRAPRGPPRSPPGCRRRAGSAPRSAPRPRRRARWSSSRHTPLSPWRSASVAEHRARERDRVAAPVVVAAHRQRRRRRGRRAAPRTVSAVTPGWSPSISTSDVAARIDRGQRRGDRRRAALAVGVVDDDLGARAGRRRSRTSSRRAADGHDELVERARARDADHVAEQRARRRRRAAAWAARGARSRRRPARAR